MSAEKLYTTEMLSATMELANYPRIDGAALHGSARSDTCGSTLDLDLQLGTHGNIERLGMQVRACAVGQAAAAIFARHAHGKTSAEIEAVLGSLSAWLAGHGPPPEWPHLGLIAPASAYRGRHGAMLLPWKAAMAALSSGYASG